MTTGDMVQLPAEGRARGFRNTLSFRRWCHRWGVPVRTEKTGRLQWVSRADVDAGVRRATGLEEPPANDVAATARAAVAAAIAAGRN